MNAVVRMQPQLANIESLIALVDEMILIVAEENSALARVFENSILPSRCTGEGSGLAVLTTPCVASSSGNSGEGADATRAQASVDPGEHSGSNWRDQSRCLVHADLAPRRAVRRVGPRPDLTRSARTGEPCGPARLLGDGSRSSCTPYRGRPVHAAAAGRRTAGVNPLAPGNRYVDGGRPSCFGSDGLPAVFFFARG